jgi:hypothetical protein
MSQEEAWAKEGAEAQRQAAEAMKKREAGNE